MIKLENISTREILSQKSGVDNYKQLSDLITNGNTQFYKFKDYLNETKRNMEKANKLGKEPIIYSITQYRNLDLSDSQIKALEDTDKKTSSANLLCFSQLAEYSAKRSRMANFSISELKHLLSHCVVNHDVVYGQNALIHHVRNIGERNAEKILKAIKIYEEQIFRQLAESDTLNLEHGLFYQDYYKKNLLVQYNIDEIVEFILDNDKEFIWGKMSDIQKRNLAQCLNSSSSKKAIKLRTDFVNMFTNYTTLEDYEHEKIKEKTLQRFIIK